MTHLHLVVRFLTDRYHGSDWPPSPARLYQALVAGGNNAPTRRSSVALLDQIASRLCALGWGVDFAAAIAQLADETPSPGGLEHFMPGARGGSALRIPAPGFLEHLEECHRAFTSRITKE